MGVPPQYRAAESLEQHLGDPLESSLPTSFHAAVRNDDAEVYPDAFLAELHAWGMHELSVPAEYGGRLRSLEEMFALARCIARRDLTAAIAHGVCFLAGIPIWQLGTEAQRRRLAELLLEKAKLGFAASERNHGHDLLATETRADATPDGFRLSGEKWCFGNARKSVAFSLLARTSDEHGPRSLSMFFVDKRHFRDGNHAYTDKLKTLGLRGHDLSGVRLDGCEVPADALVGSLGAGLEIVTKSIQLTRTLCGGLSLGAADTALRCAVDFARARRLFGQAVADIPHARAVLADAFIDMLVADCVTTTAVRAWHVATDQSAVWSAVTKYFAPVTLEAMVSDVSVVYGSRFFLREVHYGGIFQKVYRDIPIIKVFETNTTNQLHTLGLQLRQLTRPETDPERLQALRARREALFDLGAPIERFFDPWKASLYTHGDDDAVRGLPFAIEELEALRARGDASSEVVERVTAAARTLVGRLEELAALEKEHRRKGDKSPEVFELSRRFCLLHAAAASLQLWLKSRDVLGGFFADGKWLVLALEKLLTERPIARGGYDARWVEPVLSELWERHLQDRSLGVVPWQLAGRGAS